MKLRSIFYILIIIAVSCTKNHKPSLDEGIIEYDIIYLNNAKADNYPFSMPKKMITTFKKNMIAHTIEGASGNLKFSLITDNKKDKLVSLFKIYNNYYYFVEYKHGTSGFFDSLPGLKLQITGDTMRLAGYLCRKVLINSNDSLFNSFPVFYTKAINITNPNKKTPFNQIDGVLLDFCATFYNLKMHFIANKVIYTSIPDSVFNIPEFYKKINKAGLESLTSIFK